MSSTKEVLARAGAVLTDDHFVYTSKRHGSKYINKDALYPNPDHVNQIANNIVTWVFDRGFMVDVVIAPAIGAVTLEKAVVEGFRRRSPWNVLGGYSEQEQKTLLAVNEDTIIRFGRGGVHLQIVDVPSGAELVLKLPRMVINRGYEKLIPNKHVLVVEDILTTGQSARRTVKAVRSLGGNVVAVAAICNRAFRRAPAQE